MNHFLPADFDCRDSIRQEITQKLTAFEAIADELPVFIIHDARDFSVVYMCRRGLELLATSLDDIRRLDMEYHTTFFNRNDVEFYLPKFMEVLRAGDRTKWFSFFQQVATGKDGRFEWYLSTTKPFVYDENGEPLLSLTFALQLNPNHLLAEKAEKLMEENRMLNDHYDSFASLTKRERELLRYIASGETTEDISRRIFTSEKTLNTHRRNIKRKLGVKSQYDIVKFAQAFNLV